MNRRLTSLLFALLYFSCSVLLAQEPGWDLAKNGGNIQSDKGLTIHRYSPSITYAGGYFSSSISFGPITIPGSGGEDGLLIRFTADGQAVWVNRIAGPGNERVLAITSDGSGNVFATGYFESTAGFSGTFLDSKGGKDIYLAKYSQAGLLLWVRSLGSVGDDMGTGLSCDAQGNVFVTATYADSIRFIANTNDTIRYASAGGKDIVILKYDENGKITGHTRGGGTSDDISSDIVVHPTGLAFTATFSGKTGFAIDSIVSNGASDILMGNLSLNTFQPLWLMGIGGTQTESADDIDVDPQGNLYVAGTTNGNITLGQQTLNAIGGTDGVLVKVTPAKVIEWAQLIGGSGNDNCTGISIDNTGNVMTTGIFSQTVSFGNNALTSRGGTDVYVAKMNANGNAQWVKQAGSTSDDNVESISHNGAGGAVITGSHGFETILTPFTLTGKGSDDFYMARVLDIAQNDLAVMSINTPAAPFAPGRRAISATIKNTGSNTVSTGSIELYEGIIKRSTKTLPNSLAPGESVEILLDSISFNPASQVSLMAVAMLPNGQQDGNQGNNAVTRFVAPGLLKGIYTIGGTNPSFTTVAIAAGYITNWGILDSVTFHIRPAVYDAQVVIGQIPGSTPAKPVIFKADPATNQAPTISFTSRYAERNYVMVLDGTDNAQFNNIIVSANSSVYGNAIILRNNTSSLTFDKMEVNIPLTANGNGISIESTNNAENLIIQHSMFNGGDYGVHSSYDTTLAAVNFTLKNSQFQRTKVGGLHIRNVNSAIISGNTVKPTSTAAQGLSVVKALGNVKITNNVIIGLKQGNAIAVHEAPGSMMSGTLIANNMATVGENGSNGNGITLHNTGFAGVYHNTVRGFNTSLNASLFSITGGSNITALNNILSNADRCIGIAISHGQTQSMPLTISDYNVIHTDSGRVGQINDGTATSQYTTLTQWRLATTKDANSISKRITFSTDGVHLNGVDEQLYGDQSVKLIIDKDIDGDERRNSYMGADEIIPVITVLQQPVRTITCDTTNTFLFVNATATFNGQLTYQWTKNGVLLANTNNDTLFINRASYQNEGFYRCIIKSNSGADSVLTNQAQLLVSTKTTILNDIQNQYTTSGGIAMFDIGAEVASVPPTHLVKYRWFKDTVEYTANSNTVTGVNTPRLTLKNVTIADTGARYRVIVEGACGSDTSSIAGIYLPGVLFTKQPTDTIVCPNGKIRISAEVFPTIAGLDLTYEWKKGFTQLNQNNPRYQGINSPTLTIDSLNANDTSSNYVLEVIVIANNARFFSNPVKVLNYQTTAITKQPASAVVCLDKPHTISVEAQGSGVSYQWQRNDTNIIGATDATYTVPTMNKGLIGRYRVIVSGICGTTASNIANISALQELTILSQSPKQVASNFTKEISLNVYAAGVDPLRYQWYRNGVKLDGETASVFYKNNVTNADSGTYWCIISDRCDTIVSDTMNVKLFPVSVEDEGIISENKHGLLAIMPNPATDNIQARIISLMPGEVTFEIHSIFGSSMVTPLVVSLDKGVNMVPINIDGLPSGTYLCTMKMNGVLTSHTFSIVK